MKPPPSPTQGTSHSRLSPPHKQNGNGNGNGDLYQAQHGAQQRRRCSTEIFESQGMEPEEISVTPTIENPEYYQDEENEETVEFEECENGETETTVEEFHSYQTDMEELENGEQSESEQETQKIHVYPPDLEICEIDEQQEQETEEIQDYPPDLEICVNGEAETQEINGYDPSDDFDQELEQSEFDPLDSVDVKNVAPFILPNGNKQSNTSSTMCIKIWCSECPRSFHTKQILAKHKLKWHNISENGYQTPAKRYGKTSKDVGLSIVRSNYRVFIKKSTRKDNLPNAYQGSELQDDTEVVPGPVPVPQPIPIKMEMKGYGGGDEDEEEIDINDHLLSSRQILEQRNQNVVYTTATDQMLSCAPCGMYFTSRYGMEIHFGSDDHRAVVNGGANDGGFGGQQQQYDPNDGAVAGPSSAYHNNNNNGELQDYVMPDSFQMEDVFDGPESSDNESNNSLCLSIISSYSIISSGSKKGTRRPSTRSLLGKTKHKCHDCGKSYVSRRNLIRHQTETLMHKTNSSSADKRSQTYIPPNRHALGASSSSSSALSLDDSTANTTTSPAGKKSRNFACQLCNVSFFTNDQLSGHLQTKIHNWKSAAAARAYQTDLGPSTSFGKAKAKKNVQKPKQSARSKSPKPLSSSSSSRNSFCDICNQHVSGSFENHRVTPEHITYAALAGINVHSLVAGLSNGHGNGLNNSDADYEIIGNKELFDCPTCKKCFATPFEIKRHSTTKSHQYNLQLAAGVVQGDLSRKKGYRGNLTALPLLTSSRSPASASGSSRKKPTTTTKKSSPPRARKAARKVAEPVSPLCKVCKQSFSTFTTLRRHYDSLAHKQAVHLAKNKTSSLKCTLCPTTTKPFKSLAALNMHHKVTHSTSVRLNQTSLGFGLGTSTSFANANTSEGNISNVSNYSNLSLPATLRQRTVKRRRRNPTGFKIKRKKAKFGCEVCTISLTSTFSLERHKTTKYHLTNELILKAHQAQAAQQQQQQQNGNGENHMDNDEPETEPSNNNTNNNGPSSSASMRAKVSRQRTTGTTTTTTQSQKRRKKVRVVKVKKYHCQTCGTSYLSPSHLARHLKTNLHMLKANQTM